MKFDLNASEPDSKIAENITGSNNVANRYDCVTKDKGHSRVSTDIPYLQPIGVMYF